MPILKPLRWIASSRNDLRAFPSEARRNIGYALQYAQAGTRHPSAKPLHGMSGGVLEIVEDHRGSTYRAVYAIRFKKAVYVLHAFQKKSRSGIATPRHEIELIAMRRRRAADDYQRFDKTNPEVTDEAL